MVPKQSAHWLGVVSVVQGSAGPTQSSKRQSENRTGYHGEGSGVHCRSTTGLMNILISFDLQVCVCIYVNTYILISYICCFLYSLFKCSERERER